MNIHKHQISFTGFSTLVISIILLFLSVLFTQCSKEFINPTEYIKYYQKEQADLVTSVESDICYYDLAFIPNDYQIAREVVKNVSKQKEQKEDIETIAKKFEGHYYFNFRIRLKQEKSMSQFLNKIVLSDNKYDLSNPQNEINKIVSKWSFDAKANFELKQNTASSKINNTYPLVLYHLEQERLSGQGMEYMLVFKNPFEGLEEKMNIEDELILFYKDPILEPQGIQIKISIHEMNQFPVLKL